MPHLPHLPTLGLCLTFAVALPAQRDSGIGDAQVGQHSRIEVQLKISPQDSAARGRDLDALRAAARTGAPRLDLIQRLEARAIQRAADLRAWAEARGGRLVRPLWITPGAVVELAPEDVAHLRRREDVVATAEVRPARGHVHRATDGNNHGADAVQTQPLMRGAGVGLAVLDSGMDIATGSSTTPHPAFLDAMGQSRIQQSAVWSGASTADDEDGHGTLVAAIAGGRRWGTDPRSDAGFAPDVDLYNFRITDPGVGTNVSMGLTTAYQNLATQRAAGLPIHVAVCSYAGNPSHDSPEQRAADALAEYFDILLVTSAGNDGALTLPTLRSQANVNGLTVGAVTLDDHELADFSSTGPIQGDRRRNFPDLSAAGVNIVGPYPDTQIWTTASGTSFAAPMVAGTAAVLRGANSGWSTLETKAAILQSVGQLQSLGTDAPRRNATGHGLLRTDLAVTTSSQDTVARLVLPEQNGPLRDVPIQANAGQTLAATLVWHRRTGHRTDFIDNLDLLVLGPNGELVAASGTPRNVVEKVVFRAAITGTYTLRIYGTEVRALGAALNVALAHGPERGGIPAAGNATVIGVGCAGTGIDPVAVVDPPIAASAFASGRSSLPISASPMRMQQGFHRSRFTGSTTIRELCFRRDELVTDSLGGLVDLEVRLARTTSAPDQLDNVFANNPIAGTEVVVLPRRTIPMHGARDAPQQPDHFDWVIPLDTPFVFDPALGNHLLLEVRAFGWTPNGGTDHDQPLDAEVSVPRGRVLGLGSVTAPFGFPDLHRLVVGFGSGATPRPGRTPRLDWDTIPRAGRNLGLVLRDATPGAFGWLAVGASIGGFGTATLPYPLDTLGAPGCAIQTGLDLLIPVAVDAGGQTRLGLAVPAALAGTSVGVQFLILDPGANSLGVAVSPAGFALVGY